MEKGLTAQPAIGTWDKLPTEEVERKTKVTFQVNIPVDLMFEQDAPKEYQGDTGAYYIFDVVLLNNNLPGEEGVVMTSAWSLLRGLKALTPLKNKKARITKKLNKGKQYFEVIQI